MDKMGFIKTSVSVHVTFKSVKVMASKLLFLILTAPIKHLSQSCTRWAHFKPKLYKKDKQKSPGRAIRGRRSQTLTPGERENLTQIDVYIANKQMHYKHKDQLSLLQAR